MIAVIGARMTDDENITLTIHGLAQDNGLVRADVFLKKFKALLKALRVADTLVNGRRAHASIITELKIGSASASLREKVTLKDQAVQPAAPLLAEALRAIYDGDRRLERFPMKLIKCLKPLTKIEKTFSHAEIQLGKTALRIDEFLQDQTDRAMGRFTNPDSFIDSFQGIAIGVFDGILKELDARGLLVRGKLVLTAGGKEIDCIFNRSDIPSLRENFERRARVEGIAHYDGEQSLPVRLDVRNIIPVNETPNLIRWRGALSLREEPGGH